MKWPWVSREAYESATRRADVLVESVKAWITWGEAERARYDSLLEKFCAMKLAGGTIVETPAPIERKEQDEVTRRINILSVGRPGLRAQMLRQVESDRTLHGMSDIAILQRIEAGLTADEGIPA